MLAKAPTLGADMVILDLEDAVAPSEKDAARAEAVRAIGTQAWGDSLVALRCNGWTSPWTYLDVLGVVVATTARLDELMLPKVESAAQVVALELLLDQVERAVGRTRPLGIEVQIESAKGLLAVAEIAAASPRVTALVFGPGDFAASMQMPVLSGGALLAHYPGDAFHAVLVQLAVAARAHGLQVIDGPYFAVDDPDGLRAAAWRAQQLGYDGKWAIHPSQIAVLHDVFTPSSEQLDHATKLLAAHAAAQSDGGHGAARFEGEMIDEASARMARVLLARGRGVAG